MPLDGLTLHFLKNELNEAITGCRAEKIHQPAKDELVFHLRSRQGASRLLISARANGPRVNLTNLTPENPSSPPMFCMLLRKHLGSALITGVRQSGLDRVLFIDFSAVNELGERVLLTLCIEIMAKHSNIILINGEGIILDAIKRIDDSLSAVREILPSLKYELPPAQGKMNLLQNAARKVAEQALSQRGKILSSALQNVLEGASPLICRELAVLSAGDETAVEEIGEQGKERLVSTLEELKKSLSNGDGRPTMLRKVGAPFDFSFCDITQYGFSVTANKAESFSCLLDEYYSEKDSADRIRQRTQDLNKLLANATARVSRRISVQKNELEASEDRERLRVFAELINANQHSLVKGSLHYEVENYYENNELIKIPANPALSPNANSQKYYKEYRKAKVAGQMLCGLIEEGENELQYLESVADELSRASSYAEISEIRSELYAGGYLKIRRQEQKKKTAPLPPKEYFSPDGFRVLVGRNNLQNDELTLKKSNKNDLWFHTQKFPGSHVIVCTEGREIPESTMRFAARLAAYHSKAQNSSQVPVDYTAVKNLKKPAGARPGKVIYHVYNTVWVTPEAN